MKQEGCYLIPFQAEICVGMCITYYILPVDYCFACQFGMALTCMPDKDLMKCLILHPSLYILGLNFRDFFCVCANCGFLLSPLFALKHVLLLSVTYFQVLIVFFKHLQYFDLLNIFEINGFPSQENPYLFNGDFVDRGSFSLEVILTLFAFKCMCPSGIPSVALRY